MKDTIALVLEKQFARILYPGQQAFPLHYFKTSGRSNISCEDSFPIALSLCCLTVSCALLLACSCQLPNLLWLCAAVTEYLTASSGCVTVAQSLSLKGHLQE